MSAVKYPLDILIGTRVVRGPDWNWGEQDGGDGHVGTLRKCNNSEEVIVVWDHGLAAKYRYKGAHDLRILDSAPAGIKHQTICCDGCNACPIFGTRWNCSACDTFDLCSSCYHGDKHDLQHKFYCIALEGTSSTLAESREESEKISAYGLFPGAYVTKGPDYAAGFLDILPWRSGKITDIRDWNSSMPRSAAFVERTFGTNKTYRVGFEGKVDIRVTTKAKGYSFYRDHLPVFGTFLDNTKLAVGNRVRIELDLETVQLLQLEYGGWSDRMDETLTSLGTITGFTLNNGVFVSYPSGHSWILNPAALTLYDETTADILPFKVDDFVRISDDLERVKILQHGHGGWSDTMITTLGKLGAIDEIMINNDLKVFVAGQTVRYNPACVSRFDVTGKDSDDQISELLMHVKSQNLIAAAMQNDIQKMQTLISSGNVLVNYEFEGTTALQMAVASNSVEAVRLLIQHRADVDSKDKQGGRAVHVAAACDAPDILLLLAEAGADLNSRNDKQLSPLHSAVGNGHIRTVTCLLVLKAQPSLQDAEGDTPLHYAITNGRDDIVQKLLESNADMTVKNSRGFNCLHHAAILGNAGAITSLVTMMPHHQFINERNEDGFTALHLAPSITSLRGNEVLIQKVANIANSVEAVRLLIQYGADLDSKDKQGGRAVHVAAACDAPDILLLLAEAGADLNSRNDKQLSPLHSAVGNGHIRTVTCLLVLKAQPSLQDVEGDTPLHYAITNGRDDIVQKLLESNADMTVKNSRGFNCLHFAAKLGNAGAITSLITMMPHHQFMNEKKEDGFTALHLASLNGHLEGAEVLIQKGKVDLNAQNINLKTALHLAIQEQHMQVVQLLVEKGASLDMKDKGGNSPMHEAVRCHIFLHKKQLQDVADVRMVLMGFETSAVDSNTSAPIACLLAAHGADLSLRNNANQTPLDFCLDPMLSKNIGEWHAPNQRYAHAPNQRAALFSEHPRTSIISEAPRALMTSESPRGAEGCDSTRAANLCENATVASISEVGCIVCSDMPRDTLFMPCCHIATCSLCSPRVKKCLICKEEVTLKVQIGECYVCSDKKSNILFKPCGHICVCDSCARLTKKCTQCRAPIEKTINYADLCGFSYSHQFSNGNEVPSNSNEVRQLTQQLNNVREQMLCPICFDRNRNTVFMCGHGTCQVCSERIDECPMCRKPIEMRVLLFLT